MENLDRNYLRLQFWLRIHEKSATEFQSFFEDIMQEAFSVFRRFGLMETKVIVVMIATDQTREYTIKYILPENREKRKQMLQKSSKKISKN